MTARVRTAWASSAFALALLAGAPAALAGPTCSGSNLVDETLANGARWQLCWEHDSNAGIIFSEIYYARPGGSEQMLLAELSLAKIHVPYDDNGARFHDLTDYGAGGSKLNDLAATDCPQGTRLMYGSKHALCKTVHPRGAAYDAVGDQQQGSLLELFSVSHIGAYNYIPSYRFVDDGVVEILMGASGRLQRFANNDPSQVIYGWPLDAAANRIGISHIHNYYYRLDFDIGGTKVDDIFERIDVTADGSASTRTKTITAFTAEGSDDIAPDVLRSWRVRDATLTNGHGHAISYELVPLESGHRDVGPSYEPFTHNDIFVTRYKSNERYVSHNNIISGAPEDVTEFYAPPEAIAGGADLVVWYGLTFHHIPRDEDESRMHAHWNGFRIEPRDWSPLPEPGTSALLPGVALLAVLARRRRRDRLHHPLELSPPTAQRNQARA